MAYPARARRAGSASKSRARSAHVGNIERIAALGGLTQLHCEDGDILAYLEDKALAEGRVAPADFPATCPDWAEADAISRAIAMGALTGCPVYVVHLSTKGGLEMVREAKAREREASVVAHLRHVRFELRSPEESAGPLGARAGSHEQQQRRDRQDGRQGRLLHVRYPAYIGD